jgi:transposase-like protein
MGYKKYTDEFKREVLAMVAEGKRSVAQLERDLEITPGPIYKQVFSRGGSCEPLSLHCQSASPLGCARCCRCPSAGSTSG